MDKAETKYIMIHAVRQNIKEEKFSVAKQIP
jgi:hypothetical protein